MRYKPYPKYKESGVDWLGKIPEGWEIKRSKYLFEIKKRIAGKNGFDVLSITQKGIKIKDIESGAGQLSMDYSKYQFVEIGDFAMNHMDLLTGYVDISKYYGVTSPDYRVFSIIDNKNNSQYFLYLLQMGYKNKIFYAFGQGSSQLGRWRLPTDQFKGFYFPFPPLKEQTQIANYLDQKTKKIDTLIEKQQTLIELLKEKRQALISHVVTKGLDDSVAMKDSGVTWLGEIPEGWKQKKLKYFARIKNGQDQKKVIAENGKYPIYGSGGEFGRTNTYLYNKTSVLLGRKGTVDKPLLLNHFGQLILCILQK